MQENIDFIDFVHPELNEEVTAIGGYYVLTKEALVSFLSHSLLYFQSLRAGLNPRGCVSR